MALLSVMKHIVLDTEVFHRENFAFDSDHFERLIDLVEEREVAVYITDVVDGEVRRAIETTVHQGIELLRQERTRRILNVLARGGVPKLKGLLDGAAESARRKELIAEYEELLVRLEVKEISTDHVEVKTLREQYFGPLPPFGHKAEKKHEFPDAISVLGIKQWAATQEDPIIVVSGDHGIEAALRGVEGIEWIASLRDVIDLVLRYLDVVSDPELLFALTSDDIEKRVRNDFEHLGFYIDGEWGEVSEASVKSVHIEHVFLAKREENLVTLEFEAEVRYVASLTVDDPDQTAYDSETKETYVFGSRSTEVQETSWIQGEVVLEVNFDDPSRTKVISMSLNQNDIAVPWPNSDDDR